MKLWLAWNYQAGLILRESHCLCLQVLRLQTDVRTSSSFHFHVKSPVLLKRSATYTVYKVSKVNNGRHVAPPQVLTTCSPLCSSPVTVPSPCGLPSWSRHFQSRPLTTRAPGTMYFRTWERTRRLCLLRLASASLAAFPVRSEWENINQATLLNSCKKLREASRPSITELVFTHAIYSAIEFKAREWEVVCLSTCVLPHLLQPHMPPSLFFILCWVKWPRCSWPVNAFDKKYVKNDLIVT